MAGYGFSYGAGAASDAIARILAQREMQRMNDLRAQAEELDRLYRDRDLDLRERQFSAQQEDRRITRERLAEESKARLAQETAEREREKLRLDEENDILNDPQADPTIKLAIRLKRAGVTPPATFWENPERELEMEEKKAKIRAKYRQPLQPKGLGASDRLPSSFLAAVDQHLAALKKKHGDDPNAVYDEAMEMVRQSFDRERQKHPNLSYRDLEAYIRRRVQPAKSSGTTVVFSGAGPLDDDEEDEL